MKRLVTLALAVALGAAAPAGAAERTDDTVKPVVFISGGETGAAVDCKAVWKPMQGQLRDQRILADGRFHRFKTTPFATVSTHVGDTHCDWNVGVADSAGVETHARALADYLKTKYGAASFDAVAAGTGGVVLRTALALEPSLRLEDAVTLNAPHGGGTFDGCARKVCEELTTGSAFLRKLAGWANPQGAKGTDWTVIGSAADTVVSAASALSMDAEHKTTYLKDSPKQVLSHTSLLSNTTDGKTAKITYSHRGTQVFEWRKAPWPAERVGNDVVLGAAESEATGTPGDSACAGFNDAGGPVMVEDPGLAAWSGTKRQVSFVRTGILEAYADCFSKLDTDVYATTGTVRLNGLDITPSAGMWVTINVKTRRVKAESMSLSIPSSYFDRIAIPLAQHAPLDWTLPKDAGTLSASDIDGFGTTGKAKLFGLPLKGLHKLALGQGFVALEVNVGIPGVFSGSAPRGDAYNEQPQCSNGRDDDRDGKVDFPADTDCKNANDNYENAADGPGFIGSVRSDNKRGLQIDKFGGTVEGNLGLGKLRIGSASFWYSLAENEWSASLSATIPIQRAPDVKVGVGVKDGSLKHLSGEVSNIGLGPFLGGLYWQRIKIGYVFQPNWEATVGLGLSWGPRLYTSKGALSLVDVDGDLTFNAVGFKLSGSLSLVGDVWGKGFVEYKSGTGVTASTEVGKDWNFETADKKNSLKAELKGTFNGTFNSGSVDLSAKAGLCFSGKLAFGPVSTEVSATCLAQAQARLTANDKALAISACGQIDLGLWTGSIGYARKMGIVNGQPGSKGEWIGNSCDFAAWHTAATAAQAGAPGVTLGAGLDATVIGVVGAGGTPRVALSGPGGAIVPAASGDAITRGDGYVVIPSTGENTTYVVIARPRAGRWTVQPAAGSVPVAAVKSAEALPEPEVSAKVRGRRIEWTVKPIPGQTVRLREVGPNVAAPLGELRGRAGTLRYRPAFGRGGTRRIVADVLQNGAPRTTLTVARYRAPALRTLAAPKRVSATRGGALRWSAVRGAVGYRVGVWTSDGRELTYDLRRASARRITVKRLAGHTLERVVVRAVRADGAPGRPKTLKP